MYSMSKYCCYVEGYISVDASSEEEAKKKALDSKDTLEIHVWKKASND